MANEYNGHNSKGFHPQIQGWTLGVILTVNSNLPQRGFGDLFTEGRRQTIKKIIIKQVIVVFTIIGVVKQIG